jgi:diguanylate cyclase (GGDEF)-like protein
MSKKHGILIVDDENSNITALTHILSPDYTIYAAKSGRAAIQAAQKFMPDAILLDILMPEMDGYAVIVELKKSASTKDIPVIFITGLDSLEAEERGLALGASDYILKPFHTPIVRLRVKNQIKMIDQLRIIERLSMIDQLTKLPNRRSFESCIELEWGRAQREQTPISILMTDLDKFKDYNDTYGHQQGDIALVSVAKVFMRFLKRPGDFAARWGGEEFIVLIPNTESQGAVELAEHIRKAVEEIEIPASDGIMTKMTISIGVNTWSKGTVSSIERFISEADKALYEAKRSGRNRVCEFSAELSGNPNSI